MIHSEVADRLVTTLNEVFENCGYVQDEGACDECPLRLSCLDETPVCEFADTMSRDKIEEFLKYADGVEDRVSEEDFIASCADMQRKDDVWAD